MLEFESSMIDCCKREEKMEGGEVEEEMKPMRIKERSWAAEVEWGFPTLLPYCKLWKTEWIELISV